MQRYGMITGLKAEKVEEHKKLHAAVGDTWATMPEVFHHD